MIGIPSVLALLVVSCLGYFLGRPIASYLQTSFFSEDQKTFRTRSGLDQAEKGTLEEQKTLSDEELFELEKRAFINKTWLFTCHRSKFSKVGDYHSFDVAGTTFFVVLGRDEKLRAFHNVCRHRAYTVVRKPCGTSTRFSCKYHGWQYDDQGKLVKAPKFEEQPGFNHDINGLWEVKLVQTQEGWIFVNFDASTINLPFNDVKSNLNLGSCVWHDGFSVSSTTNWKNIANEFSDQAELSQPRFAWFPWHSQKKTVRLLGPLSLAKQLDDNLWCTLTLLPISPSKSDVRCDLFGKQQSTVSQSTVDKWKWVIEKEIANAGRPEGDEDFARAAFAYECGGRKIDLSAILMQHQRSERIAKKKLYPSIRITGTAEVDQEAVDLCDALDGLEDASELESCPKATISNKLEW